MDPAPFTARSGDGASGRCRMTSATMTTKETIESYFTALEAKTGWEAFFSDRMGFTSHTSPARRVEGRDPYLGATKRFYSMILSVDLRDLIIDGERACVLTRYELQPPVGEVFTSEVAEVIRVRNGKIEAL